jgi:hypothetical protein
MAVRSSWFCSAHSYDSVIQLANSMSHHDPSDDCVVISVAACSSCKAPQHDDFDHCAFTLPTSSGQLLLAHRETDFVMSITETVSRCSVLQDAAALSFPRRIQAAIMIIAVYCGGDLGAPIARNNALSACSAAAAAFFH